ncbi:hypothetical protein [Arcanobacterium hippocoleae]|uniref:Membrane protein n=1 Tax=Arcanobacterium hippocoleae TaxID=149017 RepID=A0ABU1T300_9ACTO|nr:hypothetical protein [Arcanobacterium hippocoleae]MDR6939743.1 putative membrane protein [Arcanobacterium hippocoleae]
MGRKNMNLTGTISVPVIAVITSILCAVALILAFTFLFRTNAEIVHGKNTNEVVTFNQEDESENSSSKAKAQETTQEKAAKAELELTRPAPENAIAGSEFKAPSGNISCAFGDGVSCTIYKYTFKAPEGCKGAPITFNVTEDSTSANCGRTISSDKELAYGTSMQHNGYACTVTETQVDCWHEKTGNGFTVARETASYSQN